MGERPGAVGTRAGALLDGRYRLGPVLAHGGMSTVYRGTDVRLDRPVAVKVMDPRLAADPAFRVRFEREARLIARIDHPAVVKVHDQGAAVVVERGGETGATSWTHDGPLPSLRPDPVAFLVMELVEGGTLRDVLTARGALRVPEAVAVLDPVLAGLAEAHRRGLVHRDVKPENVLISHTGEVKVADFGLVAAAAQAGASHAGTILGTVAYLSPEQVATGAADARSDVYAAGVLLFELLTGAPPFTGDTAVSVAYRHVHDDVPAPSTLVRDLPPELDDLVVRATRRDPGVRPADAAAFLVALRRVAERAAVPRMPPPVPPARTDDRARADDGGADPHRVPPGPRGTRVLPATSTTGWVAAGALGPLDRVPAARPRRGMFLVGVALVAVLGLLVGATGWWLGDGRWTAVPTVVGVERTAAERLLAAADLVATVTLARDDTVAAGLVAAVDPAPPARLRRGSAVRLTVSSGRPVVPTVAAGTAVADAERAVRDAGLAPAQARSREFSATAPAGTVVRTDPPGGTALAGGTRVTLVLSKGAEPPRQVRVPFLIGRTVADATAALTAIGLQADVESGFPFGGRPADRAQVVRQSHGAGSVVDRGTMVTLQAL